MQNSNFLRLNQWIFINSIANTSNFAFFSANFWWIFSGFRAKFQKIVTCVAFSIKFAKTNQKFAEILNFVKIIHYYSKLFTGVLRYRRIYFPKKSAEETVEPSIFSNCDRCCPCARMLSPWWQDSLMTDLILLPPWSATCWYPSPRPGWGNFGCWRSAEICCAYTACSSALPRRTLSQASFQFSLLIGLSRLVRKTQRSWI